MGNNKKMLLIAVLLGLITSLAIYFYLQQMKTAMDNRVYQTVVVAKSDIPAKTVVTQDMVEIIRLPQEYVHPKAFAKTVDLQEATTAVPIVKGEMILSDRVVKKGETKAGISFNLAQGKKAVTIAVDDTKAVGGLIRPGDKVDVLATLDIPVPSGTNEVNRPHNVVILQDIEVLAVGKQVDAYEKPKEGEGNVASTQEKKTVTLSVNLNQAQPLVLANERGSVRLALRSPVDTTKTPTTPFEIRDYLRPERLSNSGVQ